MFYLIMRIILLDSIRGIAFCLMFIYHIFVLLNIFNYNINLNNYYINIIGIISRNLFILIFGISLYISYKNSLNIISFKKKQLYKSKLLLKYSIIITIITYLLIPDKYIVFGILHFLSISIIILYNHINNLKNLFIIFIFILIFDYIKIYSVKISYLTSFFIPYYKSSIDHFYIFKWINIIIIGIFISYFINKYKYDHKLKKFQSKDNILSLIGKNSLILYIIHWPILCILIKLLEIAFNRFS